MVVLARAMMMGENLSESGCWRCGAARKYELDEIRRLDLSLGDVPDKNERKSQSQAPGIGQRFCEGIIRRQYSKQT